MWTVRLARQADITSVCRLSDEINAEHYAHLPKDFLPPDGSDRDEPYWRSFMGNQDAAVFVAEGNSTLIGTVAAFVSTSAPYPFLVPRVRGHIATIVVAKAFRQRGVGQALMSAAENFVRDKGADDIRLEVMAFNTGALAFYEELGYTDFSHRLWKPLR